MGADSTAYDVVLPFGKYSGQSLGKIYDTNPSYLAWMANEATMREPWRSLARQTVNLEPLAVDKVPTTAHLRNIATVDKITITKATAKSTKRMAIKFPPDQTGYLQSRQLYPIIDGSRWDEDNNHHTFPKTQVVRVVNLFNGLSNIDISDECMAIYTDEVNRRTNLQVIRDKTESDLIVPTLLPMRFYQLTGIEFIEAVGGKALIADEVGLGKTSLALGFTSIHPGKTLLIVPKNIKLQWGEQLMKFLGKDACFWDAKGPDGNYTLDYHIVHYNIIDRFVHDFNAMKLTNMICDECTYMTNYKAKRTMSIIGSYQYKETYPGIKSENVILMSGTPMKNKPRELFTLLNFLDNQRFNNPKHFVNRYEYGNADRKLYTPSGYTNLPELFDRANELMIRRTKDIRPEKKPERNELLIEMEHEEYKQYHDLLEQLSIKWAFQVPSAVDIVPLRRLLFKYKWERLIDFTDELLYSERSALIFTIHQEHAERIAAHYGPIARLVHGGVEQKKRDKYKKDLIDRVAKVGVYTIGTGGMGMDGLQYAISDAIFCERAWTPADHEQAEGRIARDGQPHTPQMWYLTVRDTIDEILRDLLASKQKAFDEAVGGVIYDGTGEHTTSHSIFKEFVHLLGHQMGKEFQEPDPNDVVDIRDTRYV